MDMELFYWLNFASESLKVTTKKRCLLCPSFTKTSKYHYFVVKKNTLPSNTSPILQGKNLIEVEDVWTYGKRFKFVRKNVFMFIWEGVTRI